MINEYNMCSISLIIKQTQLTRILNVTVSCKL